MEQYVISRRMGRHRYFLFVFIVLGFLLPYSMCQKISIDTFQTQTEDKEKEIYGNSSSKVIIPKSSTNRLLSEYQLKFSEGPKENSTENYTNGNTTFFQKLKSYFNGKGSNSTKRKQANTTADHQNKSNDKSTHKGRSMDPFLNQSEVVQGIDTNSSSILQQNTTSQTNTTKVEQVPKNST